MVARQPRKSGWDVSFLHPEQDGSIEIVQSVGHPAPPELASEVGVGALTRGDSCINSSSTSWSPA